MKVLSTEYFWFHFLKTSYIMVRNVESKQNFSYSSNFVDLKKKYLYKTYISCAHLKVKKKGEIGDVPKLHAH
jgi:hypothetical protein